MMYLKIAAGLLLAGLVYLSFHLYGQLQERELLLKQANAALELVAQAKARSDKAQVELTKKVDELNEKEHEVLVETISVPVTNDERCMSDVLKGVLKEGK